MPRTDRPPGGFPVVGIVGGGQLARMTQPAAIALGVRLRVLAESPADGAVQVVPDSAMGDHRDAAVLGSFARVADVLTVYRDGVPVEFLEKLEADGATVRPGTAALAAVRDPATLRARLAELGVACSAVPSTDRLAAARRGLAALVARSPSGQAAAWPVMETIKAGGICREVIAPAPGLDPAVAARATDIALRIAGELGVVGVLAVEMFEVGAPDGSRADGRASVMVNELAMRPHNCGHWTLDGAVTSQFEQHLRAVLDLPLGDPRSRSRWSVMANVLGGEHPDLYRSYLHVMARDPGVKVHLYGRQVRPGAVVGHVTVCGDDLDDVRARSRHAADFITGVIDE